MMECVARCRNVLKVLRAVMGALGKEGNIGTMSPDHKMNWRDLVFKMQTVMDGVERALRTQPAEMSPWTTPIYRLAETVSWDVGALVRDAPGEVGGMAATGMWPLEVLFERQCRGRVHTYVREKSTGRVLARSEYQARSPQPCSADFGYPGLALHMSSASENEYYDLSAPIGALLEAVRRMVREAQIPPGMATTYIAALVYSWYELVLLLRDYHLEVVKWSEKRGLERVSALFDFVDRAVGGAADPERLGAKNWLYALRRGHANAFKACSGYIESCERTSAQDILGGVNPGELARNPGQIGTILERTLGITGLGVDALAKIPGVDAIMKAFSGAAAPQGA